MEKLFVKVSTICSSGYRIFIGKDTIKKCPALVKLSSYTGVFIVFDSAINTKLREELIAPLSAKVDFIDIAGGDKNKNLKSVERIWQAMKEAGCERKTLVINLGGGVICDLGGFAASTYMRGVDFVNIPTTLLSQVDASVGGKTGFNFGGVKNLIGTFNQPVAVIIDTNTLADLPDREFISGFGEIIKHGLVSDKPYFDFVTSKTPRQFSAAELEKIITGSCRIKLDIISNDLHEQGQRKIVNFGHTIGHALEALSHQSSQPLLHGEAVGLGMLVEAKLSVLRGKLKQNEFETIFQALRICGLPTSINHINQAKLLKIMMSDKKNEAGKFNFTLLSGIGQAVYNQTLTEHEVLPALRIIN